jgi:hypothetical protein
MTPPWCMGINCGSRTSEHAVPVVSSHRLCFSYQPAKRVLNSDITILLWQIRVVGQ